ncbi:MAG: type II toxin-antitoxin system RelE/ParE family toxin [Candidatus Berkiella sp.]
MRIFKTKSFNKWTKKNRLTDKVLIEAVKEIDNGLVDAKLGSNLYKKRIATATKGKRGGFRTLLAYKKGKLVFFVYGFGKGEKENISNEDEENLKKAADVYLSFDENAIQLAITIGSLVEVKNA